MLKLPGVTGAEVQSSGVLVAVPNSHTGLAPLRPVPPTSSRIYGPNTASNHNGPSNTALHLRRENVAKICDNQHSFRVVKRLQGRGAQVSLAVRGA